MPRNTKRVAGFRPRLHSNSPAPTPADQPIRAEVFGIERLEQHFESLARAQRTTKEPGRAEDLLPRIRENGSVLFTAYRNIVETVRGKHEITPAEEWLLDNFHVVDGQLREIRDHLPGSYYRLLPKIAAGHLEGYPGVYGLAWAYVAHTDSRFELETLQRSVQAYQRVQPLTIGELWAVAVHLRVALVENLRRLSEQIVRARQERGRADELADRLLGLSGHTAEDPESVVDRLGREVISDAFAVQLVQRLRDQDPSVLPALSWLNERLSAQETTSVDAITREHYAQAAANVTVRNIITSMRWMSSIDWLEFFESVSRVDEILSTAPGFAAMDFTTRDRYRTEIERLSRGSRYSELEVAGRILQLAKEAGLNPVEGGMDLPGVPDRAEADSGYYLISRGRRAFEKQLGYRPRLATRFRRHCLSHATAVYLGGVLVFTLLFLGGILVLTRAAGANPGALVLLGILGLVPVSEIVVSLVNRLIPIVIPPRVLPKLELAEGVPRELRTMVVVPTLLTSQADIEEQLARLEVHYLANPKGDLFFALLTDWTDAPQEQMPDDEALLAVLTDGITHLNKRYEGPPGEGDRFLLLHRRRLWNEKQGSWIGWERKRGKLHELNRLLRGATDTTFISPDAKPLRVPPGVRYVITLDSDTSSK